MSLTPDAPDASASPALEIRTNSGQPRDDAAADPWTLITVHGEIDMDNAAELVDAINRIAGTAVVDLSEVTFLDSTGLQGLLGAQRTARQRGHELILRQPSNAVRRLLELTGLIDGFTLEDGTPEAPAVG